MKQLILFCFLFISCVYAVEKSAQVYDEGKISWQGWVRYFKMKNMQKTPKKFVSNKLYHENSKYEEQRISIDELHKKDENGVRYIPSKIDFYAVIVNESINILSSRKLNLISTVDTLNLNYLKPLEKLSGIVNLGTLKEGNCVKFDLILPEKRVFNPKFMVTDDGDDEKWIVCIEDNNKFDSFVSSVVKIARDIQKSAMILKDDQTKAKTIGQTILETSKLGGSKKNEETNEEKENNEDGKWLVIQDWNQCSVVCGDGVQYQQRICVPPKGKGKPCQGKPIIERPCHRVKCPGLKNQLDIQLDNVIQEIKPAIIASAPISTKPLRDTPCDIKETFGMLVVKAFETDYESQMLVRLVMNMKTISAFRGDDYQDEVFTAFLKDAKIRDVNDKDRPECCFNLDNMKFTYMICHVQGNCKVKQGRSFTQDWKNSLMLFKTKCKRPREGFQYENANSPGSGGKVYDLEKLEVECQKKLIKEKVQEIARRQLEEVQKQEVQASEEEGVKMIKKSQSMAETALKKEVQLESLIEREEKEREELETDELQRQIELEKKRQDYIKKAIQEREKIDENLEAKMDAKNEANKIKAEAVKEIQRKRNELKKKILQMRKLKERRNQSLRQELADLRKSTTKTVSISGRDGSEETCIQSNSTSDKRKSYCRGKFETDFVKFNECNTADEFCFVCCESEFGELNMIKRHSCYKKCQM